MPIKAALALLLIATAVLVIAPSPVPSVDLSGGTTVLFETEHSPSAVQAVKDTLDMTCAANVHVRTIGPHHLIVEVTDATRSDLMDTIDLLEGSITDLSAIQVETVEAEEATHRQAMSLLVAASILMLFGAAFLGRSGRRGLLGLVPILASGTGAAALVCLLGAAWTVTVVWLTLSAMVLAGALTCLWMERVRL